MTGFWTPENVEELKRMRAEGMSAGAIAKAFGLSGRNAVSGKLHRLGLIKGPNVSRRVPPMAFAEEPDLLLVEEPPVFYAGPVPLLDLRSHHCRFPMWESERGGLYCGKAKSDDYPYCEEHAAICYQQKAMRRRAA